jgi:hypothetical protein
MTTDQKITAILMIPAYTLVIVLIIVGVAG